jgi:antitoxin ParD1/3/4
MCCSDIISSLEHHNPCDHFVIATEAERKEAISPTRTIVKRSHPSPFSWTSALSLLITFPGGSLPVALITLKERDFCQTQAMTNINISLPESMKAFVEEQVAKGNYDSASEYLQELISQEQKRQTQVQLEELLIAGLDSGEVIEVTDEWWEQKRTQLINQQHKGE